MRREIPVCPVSDSLTVKFREVAEYQRRLCDRRCGLFPAISDHRIFRRDAFRIIFGKPFFGGLFAGKDLEMVGVADILAGVDVDQHRFLLINL
jgi:hypothetical protein